MANYRSGLVEYLLICYYLLTSLIRPQYKLYKQFYIFMYTYEYMC